MSCCPTSPHGCRPLQARLGRAAAVVVGALALLAAPGPAQAQHVLAEALTDLTFPTLLQGESRSMRPSGAGAAKFRVYRSMGKKRAPIRVTFNLPSVLQTPGGAAMPISFDPTSAAWADEDGGAMAAFNPQQGLTINVPSDDDFYVWLGAVATASTTQPSDAYAGSITITITEL